MMNTNATATYNGHDSECICHLCLEADMTAHIRATRSVEDADRLLAELGTIVSKVKGERTRFAKPGQRAGRGVVRKISDKQAKYLGFLLKTRDFTSLLTKPWFTTDVANISLAGARTLIDALLGCPERVLTAVERADMDRATDRQVAFALSLTGRKMGFNTDRNPRSEAETEAMLKTLSKQDVSAGINKLKDMPDYVGTAVEPVAGSIKETVVKIAGIYELDGEIYRMKKAKSGNHFYAMRLDRESGDAWNYAGGMARRVPSEGRKLSLEECEALSLRLGGCCMCGRTLTATVDGVGPAARFIGPICASNMGL